MSNYITGNSTKAAIVKESSFGNGYSTTGAAGLNMTSESMAAAYNKLEEETLIASKTQTAQDLGSVSVSGGISTILKPAFADISFELGLGKSSTPTSTTVDGATFEEVVYTLADVDEDLPTAAIRMIKGDWTYDYSGLTVSSLTLECPAQDFVRANFDFVGQKETTYHTKQSVADVVSEGSYKCTNAKLYSTTAGSDDIDDFDGFSWNSCPTGEVTDVESATITFDNGLSDAPATYCSGLYASQPVHGQRSVSIQCNVPYSQRFQEFREAQYTNENPDNLALMLAFCTKETYLYSGVNYPKEQIFVIIPNVSITDANANVSGQGLVDSSFTGIALSVGNTEPVKVIVRHIIEN